MDGEVSGVGAVTNFPVPPRNGEGDHAKRGGGGYPSLQRHEVYAARRLRRALSLPEVLLWRELRGQKLGAKFRRQHPIGVYIADFYSVSLRLVLEVDGEAHSRGNNPKLDAARDVFFMQNGLTVLRIAARDVLQNLEGVVAMIRLKVASPLHHPADGPPPRSGEELA